MKEILKSKVMIAFIIFILAVGYIHTEQIKTDTVINNASNETIAK